MGVKIVENLSLAQEIRRRSGSLGIPLSCVLEVVSISRSSFDNWVLGFFNPSEANVEKLHDAITLLEVFSKMKEKRSQLENK